MILCSLSHASACNCVWTVGAYCLTNGTAVEAFVNTDIKEIGGGLGGALSLYLTKCDLSPYMNLDRWLNEFFLFE